MTKSRLLKRLVSPRTRRHCKVTEYYDSLQLKEKQRRMKLRAEKMEEQRLYQELKLRRMQERATGGPAQTVSGPLCIIVEGEKI